MVVVDYIYDESMDYHMINAYDRLVARFKDIGYVGLAAGSSILAYSQIKVYLVL